MPYFFVPQLIIFFKQGDSRFNTKENLRENDAYVAIITKNGPQIDKVIQQRVDNKVTEQN